MASRRWPGEDGVVVGDVGDEGVGEGLGGGESDSDEQRVDDALHHGGYGGDEAREREQGEVEPREEHAPAVDLPLRVAASAHHDEWEGEQQHTERGAGENCDRRALLFLPENGLGVEGEDARDDLDADAVEDERGEEDKKLIVAEAGADGLPNRDTFDGLVLGINLSRCRDGTPPGAGKRDVPRHKGHGGDHNRHGDEPECVLQQCRADEGEDGADQTEHDLPADDAQAIVGATGDLGEERLHGPAGERGEEVEEPEDGEEEDDVAESLAGVGGYPEEHEEDGHERGGGEDEGDAAAPAGAGAVAPVADEGVVERLDQAPDDEHGADGDGASAAFEVAVGIAEVEEDEPEVAGPPDSIPTERAGRVDVARSGGHAPGRACHPMAQVPPQTVEIGVHRLAGARLRRYGRASIRSRATSDHSRVSASTCTRFTVWPCTRPSRVQAR